MRDHRHSLRPLRFENDVLASSTDEDAGEGCWHTVDDGDALRPSSLLCVPLTGQPLLALAAPLLPPVRAPDPAAARLAARAMAVRRAGRAAPRLGWPGWPPLLA